MKLTDQEFNDIIASVMDELPQEYIAGLNNVLITYEDDPSPEQRKKLHLRCDQTLFGLYEGTPTTSRPASDSIFATSSLRLPDKITLFKHPLLRASGSAEQFRANVKHTLWHEIAHYYGLDHRRIHAIERGEV